MLRGRGAHHVRVRGVARRRRPDGDVAVARRGSPGNGVSRPHGLVAVADEHVVARVVVAVALERNVDSRHVVPGASLERRAGGRRDHHRQDECREGDDLAHCLSPFRKTLAMTGTSIEPLTFGVPTSVLVHILS